MCLRVRIFLIKLNIALSLMSTMWMFCAFVDWYNSCFCSWLARIHSWIVFSTNCSLLTLWNNTWKHLPCWSKTVLTRILYTPTMQRKFGSGSPELVLDWGPALLPEPAVSQFSPKLTSMIWPVNTVTHLLIVSDQHKHGTYYKSNTITTPATLPSFLFPHLSLEMGYFLPWLPFSITFLFE